MFVGAVGRMTTLAYGLAYFGALVVGLTVLAPLIYLKYLKDKARDA